MLLFSACSAHASESFASREASLNARKGIKSYEVTPQKPPKVAQAVPQTDAAEKPSSDAVEPTQKEAEPVPTETFKQPQNPEKKRLSAALTCGKLILQKGGKAKCLGPVRMWREDVEVTCAQATAFFDNSGRLSRLHCDGDVRIVTEDRVGFSKRAIYDEAHQKITLKDEAKLKQRGMQLQGEQMVLDLMTEEVTVEGGVKGLYSPAESQADQ